MPSPAGDAVSTAAVGRRRDAIELRIRLERAAAAPFDAACPAAAPGGQTRIACRLLFLVGLVESSRQPEVHRLAHVAGHVYERTSDLLHGRMRALALPCVVIDRSREIVASAEEILRE